MKKRTVAAVVTAGILTGGTAALGFGFGFGKRVGDTTSIAVERISEVAAAGLLQSSLDQVGRAEKALQQGTYGTCENCGGPVGAARQKARPEATRCVACA